MTGSRLLEEACHSFDHKYGGGNNPLDFFQESRDIGYFFAYFKRPRPDFCEDSGIDQKEMIAYLSGYLGRPRPVSERGFFFSQKKNKEREHLDFLHRLGQMHNRST